MSLKKTWTDAIEASASKFPAAYNAWKAKLHQDKTSQDIKVKLSAEKQLSKVALKETGLDQGPKFMSYCTFKGDIGSMLDKLEALADGHNKVVEKMGTLRFADVAANKSLLAAFNKHCADKGLENYPAYMISEQLDRKNPEYLWETYLKPNAKRKIAVPSNYAKLIELEGKLKQWQKLGELLGRWNGAANAPVNRIRTELAVFNGTPEGIKAIYKAYGGATREQVHQQADKCLEQAMNNFRVTQAYEKRWSGTGILLKDNFWLRLQGALNTIVKEVTKIKKG